MSMVTLYSRLLTLLLILHWCVVNASGNQVFQIKDFESVPDTEETNPGDVISSLSYRYSVWNRCTGRFLRIRKPGRNGVDAKGDKHANYTSIIIESIGQKGLVRIKGETSGLYLCYSRRGKLRAKERHSEYCTFNWVVNDNNKHDEFRLNLNSNWYIGFRKRRRKSRKGFGKPLPGYLYKTPKMKKCFQFLVTPLDARPQQPRPPIDWTDDALINYDPEGPYIRWTRRHKPRIQKSHKHRHGHGTKKNGRRKNRNKVKR
ncbi:fibroblast growth factor 18-like isoform X2 [Mizuhopecten yessoensis]|uniref:fibroblast growth factor 18-like isoform X2 n=1 Tax=Mizuhopecten yessoensis TaxID=6573 RepID=UPI000B459503|nr:fibroblast growth factor 18-like isoform X2 [Mizuhopecten yessoensis]